MHVLPFDISVEGGADFKSLTAEDFLEGQVLLVDKPLTWSSYSVVNKLKIHLKHEVGLKKFKIGHAGTLDPLATGLLIVCTGKKTKTIDEIQSDEKEYTGTFTLGATTASYDLETEIDEKFAIDDLTEEQVRTAVAQFQGEILQYPPIFSAVKIDGKRAYKAARKGKELKMRARLVEINKFELTRIELPEVDFVIRCSKGTYIRSVAHDFGKALDNGAHLSALRRTKIGEFSV